MAKSKATKKESGSRVVPLGKDTIPAENPINFAANQKVVENAKAPKGKKKGVKKKKRPFKLMVLLVIVLLVGMVIYVAL